PAPSLQSPAYDPRSYLAQSVPKRMAIISAGVIMNLIFAFVLAVAAFSIGVEQPLCIIGNVYPGEAGWQAGLRPGDEIVEIDGKKMHQFRDLQTAIQLGDIDEGDSVELRVRRPGIAEPFTVMAEPDRSRGAFILGVGSGYTTQLLKDRKTWLVHKFHAVVPGSAADRAEPPLQNGDRIVMIDDAPIDNYAQIASELARKVDAPIKVTVERDVLDAEGKPTGEAKLFVSTVPPQPMRRLGLAMKMGEVAAVRKNSPAAAAGIAPGDVLVDPAGDPMRLPDWLRRRAGKTVELKVRKKGAKEAKAVSVSPGEPNEFSSAEIFDCQASAPALGVAYHVLNRIERVDAGGPAADSGLRPGDTIKEVVFIPPDEETLEKLGIDDQKEAALDFSEKARNWVTMMDVLQGLAPGTLVELTVLRKEGEGEKEYKAKLTPAVADDWFAPDRGLRFEAATFARKASSPGEALALGGQETLDNLTIVFRSVKSIGMKRVSMRGLAGPITIFWMILQKADEGPAKLLLFLTLLSANLAVINFFPIPVLDGGHFVLLCYEGIRGKPANENVQAVLAYIGLALILALMAWVIGLDLGIFSRQA
ncbi:MAG: site-2 protease family protein, partial [Pirellulales bacterium]|nr:site-2 protease family protein [Pirellulales bacterium]